MPAWRAIAPFQRKDLLLQDPFHGRIGRAQRDLAAVEYDGEATITADEPRPARDGIPGCLRLGG